MILPGTDSVPIPKPQCQHGVNHMSTPLEFLLSHEVLDRQAAGQPPAATGATPKKKKEVDISCFAPKLTRTEPRNVTHVREHRAKRQQKYQSAYASDCVSRGLDQ
jgi:hypothetical protein